MASDGIEDDIHVESTGDNDALPAEQQSDRRVRTGVVQRPGDEMRALSREVVPRSTARCSPTVAHGSLGDSTPFGVPVVPDV